MLVLAVGNLATVGLFADCVRLALQQEATSLIGAAIFALEFLSVFE